MLFGRVKGTAICTIKYQGTEGLKLLVVQPLNKRLEPIGILQVAADVVQAGRGDLCVMVRSREAALAMPDVKFVPMARSITVCGKGIISLHKRIPRWLSRAVFFRSYRNHQE